MKQIYFATAAAGLEGVVKQELIRLNMQDVRVEDNRIFFSAEDYQAAQALLWLRSGDRVYRFMGSYPAETFDQLFEGAKALPWEDVIPQDAEFPVVGRCVRSKLMSLPDCQKILKKAIVERLKTRYPVQWFQETGPTVRITFALHSDRVVIGLDACGTGLHKRGYRPVVGEAPLKETMAAALVRLSPWYPDKPFWDPMCGTGTLAIEAALIGCNRAPGLMRSFDMEQWPFMDAAAIRQAREDAQDALNPNVPLEILASDVDEKALDMARFHAEQAGVSSKIRFVKQDVRAAANQAEYGVIVTNPPYGERMGEEALGKQAVEWLGDLFRRQRTYSLCALTSVQGVGRAFRKSHDKVRRLYNGRLECGFYIWYGPRRPAPKEP